MSLTPLVVISLLLGLFIAALWQPVFGIAGYISVYLIYNPNTWWGDFLSRYLPKPSFMAMVFLVIGSIIHARELNWSFSRREYEFYLFLGIIWLSSFVFGLGVQDDNWMYIVKMIKLFVFIFFFIRVINSLHDYKLVVWIFILGALFLAYQSRTVSASYFHDGRLDGIGGMDFGEGNGVAALMALAMIFLGFEILRTSWWKKLPFVFGIALILNTIILTQSRGVFTGLLVTVPYFLYWSPSEYRKTIFILTILGAVLFFILTNGNFMTRMNTMSEEMESGQEETLTRLDFWKTSIRIFKDHPFGIGVKNFEKLVTSYDYRNPGMDAHNTYVICYSETGILGIALFLVIIAETFLQLRQINLMAINLPGNEAALYTLALGGVLIVYLTGYGMTHTTLYKEILWMLFSMPICLENISRKLLSATSQEKIDSES